MDDKIKKLEDLIELYKSNSITKEEYDLLKNELLIDNSKEVGVKNNSTKPIIEGNIFEEIKTKNNYQQPITYKVNINESKTKKNTNLIYLICFSVFIFILFISFYEPTYKKEIREICSDCKQFEKISNTSWILVTNSSKKINIYDENGKSFILNKWYAGDISGFGITFYKDYDNGVYTGILVSPEEYSKLLKYRDDLVQGNDPETQVELDKAVKEYGETSRRLKSTEALVCKNCPGKSCSRCFGRGWYQGHDSSKDDPNNTK